ncbi:hypothetical protein [Flavobacterium laiguense]|uniref:Uncharacterized protein n=1 Tax=Flavobacterium laiguense TaxID=2169409 RepID=A0A2U1JSH6_9FLAO|nr:hypothetical protein [Flavobacterium laiguense]PWA07965.1 hypothetical protein DB891_13220 [Flavobacterium laiguense]
MSSKTFTANALHAKQDVAKHAANLFGSAKAAKKVADEQQLVTGTTKDLIRLSTRWEDLEDFKVCCLSSLFIELKA